MYYIIHDFFFICTHTPWRCVRRNEYPCETPQPNQCLAAEKSRKQSFDSGKFWIKCFFNLSKSTNRFSSARLLFHVTVLRRAHTAVPLFQLFNQLCAVQVGLTSSRQHSPG